jgi:hypothetical protein
VPEALFSKTGYTVYQTIVFLLVACTIYWVIVQWAAWRRVRAAMGRVDQLCEVVLTYLKIMYERGEDPRQTMPSPQPHAYVTRKGTKSSRRTRRPRAQ